MATRTLTLVSDEQIVRRRGIHAPAAQVLEAARPLILAAGGSLPAAPPPSEDYDYTQVDPALAETEAPLLQGESPPPSGTGYAGMSPAWRRRFLMWQQTPGSVAPPLFRELLVATLECELLDSAALMATGKATSRAAGHKRFVQRLHLAGELAAAPSWHGRGALMLGRAALLGRFVAREAAGWVEWWCAATTPPDVRDLALGMQALLGIPLTAAQLAQAALDWGLVRAPVADTLAALRLDDLCATTGNDPLQWALAQAGEAARSPVAWRTVHRDLRLALPQPALRPHIEPLLAEAFSALDVGETRTAAPPPDEQALAPDEATAPPTKKARHAADAAPQDGSPSDKSAGGKQGKKGTYSLVLEFGHSRSEFYDFAVEIAQRHSTYVALLDEKRRLVHRVIFTRSQLRSFWRLWDYVQNWNDTHVYLNGRPLEKWKIWPWSHYINDE